MKKQSLLLLLLCVTLFTFGQRNGSHVTDATKWVHGTLIMNNGTAQDLDLDTTLVNGGFTSLNIVATSHNTDEFKFERDRFDIAVINDFKLPYVVKEGFIGSTITFTLYIYSGKMMIYKKDYLIMFDGSRNPKLIMQAH